MKKVITLGLVALTFGLGMTTVEAGRGGSKPSARNTQRQTEMYNRVKHWADQVLGDMCQGSRRCGDVSVAANNGAGTASAQRNGNGNSRVRYSPRRFQQIEREFGEEATYGIIAHEVGHHFDMNGHRKVRHQHSWESELAADEFAGCALAKREMDVWALVRALHQLSPHPTSTHPDGPRREEAIVRGFTQCGGEATARPDSLRRQGHKPQRERRNRRGHRGHRHPGGPK